MPIYDYTCPKCNLYFETLLIGNGSASCPNCQSFEVIKQCSKPAPYQVAHHTSTTPRSDRNREMERREKKRERVTKMIEKQTEK